MVFSRWKRCALGILGAALASHPVASNAQAVGDSQLSGYVYIDRNNDGVLAFSDQASPELVIPGVEIRLINFVGTATQIFKTTTTDSIGKYIFTGLPAGPYVLQQTQPVEFVDGLDTVGVLHTLLFDAAPPGAAVGSASGANNFVN